jgi:hypothetical protein
MSMAPLAAFKPPPTNAQAEHLFRSVYGALNDIDRSLYPPVEALHERHADLIAAYEAIGKRFDEDARTCGLTDWLRFTIVNRKFGVIFNDEAIDSVRRLYEEMEQLGYPDVSPLISVRMIWANRLAEDGELKEAQTVARQLIADVEEFRRRSERPCRRFQCRLRSLPSTLWCVSASITASATLRTGEPAKSSSATTESR